MDRVHNITADAILLTHAHRDHAWGLKRGAPCRIYATAETWCSLDRFPIIDRAVVPIRAQFRIRDVVFEAFRVEHSLRAAAVGYRITGGRSTIFYAPDLVYIPQAHEALMGIRIYVGDGASVRRPIVRKSSVSLIGYAGVAQQLAWCSRERVTRMLITHCGSQIVGAPARLVKKKIRELGIERGVDTQIACDGFEVLLP